MLTAIFKDPELQARFERDGYVVFDFISPEQATLIAEKYYQLQKEIPIGFSSTAENPDYDFKKAISDHAGKVIQNSMEDVFQNYKKLGISFLCKAPGKEGKVPVHRDWMVVDETRYFSGTIWVPMSDVTDANGALRVWPGSHKFFNHIRSSTIPVAYSSYEDDIWDQMTVVPMKAGQAFLLNHAVIHASSPNITNKERLILVCGIVPAEAKLSYYHGIGNGIVEKFDMPDDMFMKHSEIGGRPSFGVKTEEFEYHVEPENRLRVQHLLTSSHLERSAKPVFSDEKLNRDFSLKGYLKLPVLNTAQLNDFTDTLQGKQEGLLSPELTDKLTNALFPKIAALYGSLKVIDARVEIKRKNTFDPETLHQQTTCVDNEDEYCSLTCWIPLSDVNIENGTIGFIEGSHLYLDNKRPSPQPVGCYAFNGDESDVLPYLNTVSLKAGEAIILDDRLFRCSLPNTSSIDVMGISLRVVHSKAQLCHYYLNPDGKKNVMLKYLADEAFFKKYNNAALSALYEKGEKPTGYEITDTISYHYPEFSTDELIALIKADGGGLNHELEKRLAFNKAKMETTSRQNTSANKNLWSTYSPINIVREIKKRVLG